MSHPYFIFFISTATTGDEFHDFLLSKSVAEEALFHKQKAKILKVRIPIGAKNPIEQMFTSPEIMSRLTDVKVMEEVNGLFSYILLFSFLSS